MKSVLACVSLSLISACAFATEAAAVSQQPCAEPVVPPVSTSSVGVNRVQKSIEKWNNCVASQATEENKQRDEVVKQKIAHWVDATLQYSGARHAGVVATGRHEHERVTPRIVFDEIAKLKALTNPAL